MISIPYPVARQAHNLKVRQFKSGPRNHGQYNFLSAAIRSGCDGARSPRSLAFLMEVPAFPHNALITRMARQTALWRPVMQLTTLEMDCCSEACQPQSEFWPPPVKRGIVFP